MTDKEEDLATIAYMHGYEKAKSRWVGLTGDELREGIKAANPEGMDICPWSFEQGAQFAEQKLKDKNT